MRIWIREPLAILAEGAAGGMVVEDDRIVECLPSGARPSAPVDEIFDAHGHVVVPGLINLHHHFYQTLTRAFPPALDKPLFPWLEVLYPVWAQLRPEQFAVAARTAMVELLRSGCTTAVDHHYLFPHGMDNAIDIELEVADKLGIRTVMTRGSMSLSQDDGGLPPRSVVQREDAILADSERLLARYHDTEEGALHQIALAPCSPFSVTADLMRESAELARRHNALLHTHLSETEDETDYCLAHFGRRPVDYLGELDWISDDVWVAHGIHFDAGEVAHLGAAGVGVAHCPSSNMILASGCCPVQALETAGAPIGLGVDGSASNDASNLIAEIRQAFLLQRLHTGASEISHRDALRWATEGGARCLNRPELGRIAPGCQADFALFRMDALDFAGASDPLAALVLCAAQNADRVMVAGVWRLIDGEVPGVDLMALAKEQRAASRALLSAAGVCA